MSDSRAAAGLERLPWLADEPKTPAKRGSRDLAAWAVAAAVIMAGVSFWIGSRSETVEPENAQMTRPSATVPLPQPRPVPHAQEVRIAPEPQVRQVPSSEVRPSPPPEIRAAPESIVRLPRAAALKRVAAERATPGEGRPSVERETKHLPAQAAPAPPVVHSAPLRPWPPRVMAGAAGRLVQIGAYGSPVQAKHGWVSMVRAYPAVQRLPAIVVETRNSRARAFYRFQIGTTSQAHSEVLCQRMQKIQLSCAVVGLPWKGKVER